MWQQSQNAPTGRSSLRNDEYRLIPLQKMVKYDRLSKYDRFPIAVFDLSRGYFLKVILKQQGKEEFIHVFNAFNFKDLSLLRGNSFTLFQRDTLKIA
jgi:hypothetical protein